MEKSEKIKKGLKNILKEVDSHKGVAREFTILSIMISASRDPLTEEEIKESLKVYGVKEEI